MNRRPSSQHERGFALAGAVFALVVIAVLVTGAFFVARQENTIGKNSATYEKAFEAAEAGLGSTLANWSSSGASYNTLGVGNSTSVATVTLPSSGGSYSGYVRRLNTELFVIRITGLDNTGTSSRTVSSLVRLQNIQVDIKAGLTTQGDLKVGGSSFITGVNTNPTGWTCPTATDTLAGVRTADSTQISTSGCTSYSCLQGNPKIQQDTTVTTTQMLTFGDLQWSDLTAMANKTYPGSSYTLNDIGPVGTATTCTTSIMDNWGDPAIPPTVAGCSNYMPIVYFAGDAQFTGGLGQGILLIGGNLSVQGGFQFYGPVIVRGTLSTQGTGGHFMGGVLAANVNLQLDDVLGNALITYSSCAITKALTMNSPGKQLSSRSWMEVVQ